MVTMLFSAWQRYFAQPAASAPTAASQRPVPPPVPVRRLYGGYTIGSPVGMEAHPLGGTAAATDAPCPAAGGAVPPARPRPPVDQRPLPQKRPRPELAWLTWQTPAWLREAVALNLRQTLGWRAQHCQPLNAPKTPHDYRRFGLLGGELVPHRAGAVCETLRDELRELIRVVEGRQPILERNHLLAMHSIRLGQLCAELEQRGLDALEEVRAGLNPLWD